ncbi:unnamed protein product, partial [Didymodactylos carnosus]
DIDNNPKTKINVKCFNKCCMICHCSKISYSTNHLNISNTFLETYTHSSHTLITNHILNVLSRSSEDIEFKDVEAVQIQTKLLYHPVFTKLMSRKWYGLNFFLYLLTLFFYATYLGLFTWAVMRNTQPHIFYDTLLNVTTSDDSQCEEIARIMVKTNNHIKDSIDYGLKYTLYVLLWIHIFKGILLIVGVYRYKIHWRCYMEVTALVLSFIYIYDTSWQNEVQLRCPIQWQIGSLGLCLGWITLLAYLRSIPPFGIYVIMLEVIIQKFLWFFPLLIIVICSFGFSFYMLLQNQVVFGTIFKSLIRTSLMILDLGYENRFFDQNGTNTVIEFYSITYFIFMVFAIVMSILVNNLLIGLVVGDVPSLSELANFRHMIIQYDLLSDCKIFHFQYLRFTPKTLVLRYMHKEKVDKFHPKWWYKWFQNNVRRG